MGRRRHNEAGPSRPQDKAASSRTMRPRATAKLQEKGIMEDPICPSRNVFDRLSQNRGEDMCTHLNARRTLVTSRRRQEEAVVSPVNDEINKLRARLEKLAARNTEVVQSTSTSSFSMEIQQAPLPISFRLSMMATYNGKTDPLEHRMLSIIRWIFYKSHCSLAVDVLQSRFRHSQEMDSPNRTRNHHLLGTTMNDVYTPVPRSPQVCNSFDSPR